MLLTTELLLKTAKKGDILIMTSFRFDPIASIIRWGTGSKYSHTVIYCGDGEIVEAIYTGVHCAHWDDLPYQRDYNITILRPQMSEEDIGKAVAFAKDKVGDSYDYFLMIAAAPLILLTRMGLKLRGIRNLLDLKKAYICSELAVDSYFEGAGKRIVSAEINRSQVVPDDLKTYGLNLDVVGDFYRV